MSSVGDCQTRLLNNNSFPSWLLFVSVAWCLLLKCPTVCWLCSFLFATLDINATWMILERIYLEKNRSLFLWSVRRSPGTLCWKQASYFSELAFIYVYFDLHVLPMKGINDLSGFCHKSYDFFENPFPKYKYIILTPYMEVLGGKILFQTIRWEKKNIVYSKLLWKYLDKCEMPWDRCWSGEMVNGDVYKKMHIESLYLLNSQ